MSRNYGLQNRVYIPPAKRPSRLGMVLEIAAGGALLALLLGVLGFAALVAAAWLGPLL